MHILTLLKGMRMLFAEKGVCCRVCYDSQSASFFIAVKRTVPAQFPPKQPLINVSNFSNPPLHSMGRQLLKRDVLHGANA